MAVELVEMMLWGWRSQPKSKYDMDAHFESCNGTDLQTAV